MEESNTIYERRGGVDANHGIDFEWQTTNFAYLRCEKFNQEWVQDNSTGVKSYLIANNVDGIGAFDDVVIRVEYPHQNEDKIKLIFVQCKHLNNPRKFVLDKFLNRESVQNYFDSFIEVLRILNNPQALSCQTYKEINIRKKTKRPRPKEMETNVEGEQKLRNLFHCKPQDCEFILYSNMILDVGSENTQTQLNNDISMKILNTAGSNEFNILLNAKQLEYLSNEQFIDTKEIFEELKQEFVTKFRLIVNQVENDNLNILKSIKPTADIEGISPLLDKEVRLMFQNIPCSAITQNSQLLENIENFCNLKTLAKNEMDLFLHIPEHGQLFSNDYIESLQKQIDSDAQLKIYTSCINLEKLKLKQFVSNKSKFLVFINNEGVFGIWAKARNSRMYRNLDQIFVCFENKNIISEYDKDTNEVFIEIHQNMENDPSFFFAQFSDETSNSILNHAITFQGFTVTVNDICGDEWRRLFDEETICRILRREKITIGNKFFDSLDCYMERNLKFNEHISYKSDKKETKILTEDKIIAFKNRKAFLLSGPAGIGKSTTLKSLALKYKNKNSTYFVYFIELNKYLNVLKKYKQESDIFKAIEFLAKNILGTQELEYRLFVYACAEKKNVALFFDAFDEISPDGEEKFSSFLETLLKTNVSSIFVTSRPNFIGTLEKRLKQDSLIFEPLTLDDKKFFFLKYYEKLTTTNTTTNDKEEMENVISQIIKSMEEERELMAIPLQITMLAEIHFEKFSEMTTEEKMSFSIKMDICSLYNAFIEKLVERYLVEKKKVILQDEERIIAIRDKMRDAAELVCKLICPDINQTPLAEYSDAIVKMCNQVGLITNIDPPVFLHRTYGEFLAANWFVQCIMNEKQNTSSCISVLCKNVLYEYQYRDIRSFINAILCNINSGKNDSLIVNANVKVLISLEHHETSLHIAAEEKHSEIVNLLVQNDPSKINKINIFGSTAFQTACKSGCFKSVEIMISNNCLINTEDNSQYNALHHAAISGNADIINLILEKDPTLLRKKDTSGNTAFIIACRRNKLEAMMCFLKFDSGLIDIADKLGDLPLHYATKHGHIQIVKKFLCHNSNLIDTKRNDGLFPLHIACKYNHVEVAKYLLTQKLSLATMGCGEKEETPLHFAARNGNIELMMLLLQHKQTLLNKCNLDGESPLLWALLKQKTATAKFLLTFPNCLVSTGQNPLTLAVEIGDIDIMSKIYSLDRTLLNKVGEKFYRGCTPLICALKMSNIKAADFLLRLTECSLTPDLDEKSPLHYAATDGNLEIIKLLIDKDRSLLLKRDKNGKSALCFAIDAGQTQAAHFFLLCVEYFVEENILQNELESGIINANFEIITMLLERCPTLVNKRNRNLKEFSPLDNACELHKIEAVKHLTPQNDSSLIFKSEINKCILHIAAKAKNFSMFNLILENFPTLLNQRDSCGRTALHYACQDGNTEVAQQLLNQDNCQIDVYDDELKNPLHLASEKCNIEIMKMILEHDNTLLNTQNKKGQTPLHLTLDRVWFNHEEYMSEASKYLLSLNCSVHMEDLDGKTSIHLASKNNNVEIIKLLLAQDITLLNQQDRKGLSPLHHACKYLGNDSVNFLLKLPECDINLTDNEGNSPLHHAVMFWLRYDILEILPLLVQRDRSLLTLTNNKGQTALHLAAIYSIVEIIEFLLRHMECKANVQDINGNTPIHSCIQGSLNASDLDDFKGSVLCFFVKHDFSLINMKNYEGRTPLHIAVTTNEYNAVKLLVWYGADVHIKDNKDCTPLDLALQMKQVYGKSISKYIIDILQNTMRGNSNN